MDTFINKVVSLLPGATWTRVGLWLTSWAAIKQFVLPGMARTCPCHDTIHPHFVVSLPYMWCIFVTFLLSGGLIVAPIPASAAVRRMFVLFAAIFFGMYNFLPVELGPMIYVPALCFVILFGSTVRLDATKKTEPDPEKGQEDHNVRQTTSNPPQPYVPLPTPTNNAILGAGWYDREGEANNAVAPTFAVPFPHVNAIGEGLTVDPEIGVVPIVANNIAVAPALEMAAYGNMRRNYGVRTDVDLSTVHMHL